jgi:murein DD-endopeptidase MepM/ murein hydrolase activator NlpD
VDSLSSSKIAIIFVPGGKRVRQIEFPGYLFKILLSISAILAVFLLFILIDYTLIKIDTPGLSKLKKENQEKESQNNALAQKIIEMNENLKELQKLDQKLRAMINLEKNSPNQNQVLGVGGSSPQMLEPVYSIEKVRNMHRYSDNLKTAIAIQMGEKKELYGYFDKQRSMLACTPSVWPIKGWVTSDFGYRISPFTNEKEFHRAMDIGSREGTIIIAPADGVVVAASSTDYGYGNLLTISHGYGLKTRFAHLSAFLVKPGDRVKRGQEIAKVGNTGRSTAAHLHYEILLNEVPVNPQQYILN